VLNWAVSYGVGTGDNPHRGWKLKSFGTLVQYSVFEAILNRTNLARMEKMIRAETEAEDLVRLYFLCGNCQRRIIAIHGIVTNEAQTIVI